MMLSLAVDLPREVAAVLPSEPYAQLELANKIISFAYSQKVSLVEAEAQQLREALIAKNNIIKQLERKVANMENEVAELQVKSKMAVEEQHRLGTEKGALIETVKRLNREVSRLDAFKRSLLQHLHDDEEPAQLDHSVAAVDLSTDRLVADVLHSAMKATQHPQQSQSSGPPPGPSGGPHTTSSYLPRSGPSTSTQHLGRGGPAGYASSTPSQQVSHTSPRGPTSPRAYVTSTPQPSGSHHYGSSQGQSQTSGSTGQYVSNGGQYTSSKATVEPRMEAKDFFRHARAQLSYEAFSQFLQAIKQHNAGLASRDDTLRSARLIFGPGATDLYDVFEGLLTRNGAGLS
ncbi:hypothetical protein V8C86DRAFT_2547951 [Haematococcus lacustris]